ncbi:MAG: GntR family transcriptional regulator [Elusimicrobia bacterium HGW-Elusimicrobia-2]|nr:MAG: GntR family transcriptional regulator [Elusimicrobia bacterium HGW-Elusimicrobia-2]
MVEIGNFNKLKVVKHVDFGVYLAGGELGEILMPIRYVSEGCKDGDIVEVFVYRDSEDRVIATTEQPLARIEEFAFLKAVTVNNIGAFLDWGLMKDLFVPFREQEKKMEEGKSYVVKIYLDKKSDRIAASSRLTRFLDQSSADYKEGQSVELLVCGATELGYKAVINSSHMGIIYKNEVFRPLHIGDRTAGFIKKIREDGKIDLSLQEAGHERIGPAAEIIISKIKEAGGFLPVTDKSEPEIIYTIFGMSKKVYKKACGTLYKKRLIIIDKKGLKLNSA